jgi:hypothetical protein
MAIRNALSTACGHPAAGRLYLRYRYPRLTCEPQATDPWYVHGSWPVASCGSAACEAGAFLALMAEHPEADVSVLTEAERDLHSIFDAGDSDAA